MLSFEKNKRAILLISFCYSFFLILIFKCKITMLSMHYSIHKNYLEDRGKHLMLSVQSKWKLNVVHRMNTFLKDLKTGIRRRRLLTSCWKDQHPLSTFSFLLDPVEKMVNHLPSHLPCQVQIIVIQP